MSINQRLQNNVLFRVIGYTGISGVLRLAVGGWFLKDYRSFWVYGISYTYKLVLLSLRF